MDKSRYDYKVKFVTDVVDPSYMQPQSTTYKLQIGESTGGLKFDQNKPRMDLLDPEWLENVARVLGFGAEKYLAHNWRSGILYSRLYAGVQRHLAALQRGEDIDPESGLKHVWHASCGLMFIDWTLQHRPALDDRWKEPTHSKTE